MKIFPLRFRLSRRKSLQPTEVLSSTTLTQEIRLQVQMTIVGIKCKWRQNGSNKWNMKLKKVQCKPQDWKSNRYYEFMLGSNLIKKRRSHLVMSVREKSTLLQGFDHG